MKLSKLHLKSKVNRIALGLSGLLVGALTFGITATSSAWGYGGYGGYGGGYGGYGGYGGGYGYSCCYNSCYGGCGGYGGGCW